VFADPHLVAREMAVDVDHPTLGRMKSLREYGFSESEISAMRTSGAIR
jgi:hypothetical protein